MVRALGQQQLDFQSRITGGEPQATGLYSVDEFKQYVQDSGLSPTQAGRKLEQQGIKVEGVENARKQLYQTQKKNVENGFKGLWSSAMPVESEQEGLKRMAKKAMHYSNPMNVVSQFIGAGVSKVPSFVGNTVKTLRDMTGDFYAEKELGPVLPKNVFMKMPGATEEMYEQHVEQQKEIDKRRIESRQKVTEQISSLGNLMQKRTQEVLGVDPTLPESKAGELVSSIWLSVYGGPNKLAASNTLRGAGQRVVVGGVEGARYSAGEEGEIQRQEVVMGMVAEPIAAFGFDKVLGSLTKEAPEQLKKRLQNELRMGVKTQSEVMREMVESTAPKVSMIEKTIGIDTDIKRRIHGKRDMLQDYFNVSHARNSSDTMPTPLAYASEKVVEARDKLVVQLDDTGSEIGKFRNKVSGINVGIDNMNKIQSSFENSIKSLNLTVKDGQVVRVKGKVKGRVSDSEVKALQDMFDDILTVKQSGKVEDVIDLRIAIDDKVKFAKTAREASDVLDGVARDVRAKAAEANLSVIGREQGQLYKEYSEMMELLNELNKYVNSRSGPEFILKRVLSERDRVVASMFDTLSKYTGIDLRDHATMASIATDVVGNPRQKGLFRQEISKAGLDAADVISQISPRAGFFFRQMQSVGRALLDEESIFLKAADEPMEGGLKKMGMNFGGALDDIPTKGVDNVGGAGVANVSDDLLQEARKYKSADEFLEQFEYHGGPEEIKGGKLERLMADGGDMGGVFTTKDKDYANIYANNYLGKGKLHRVYVGDKKIIDLTSKEGIQKMKDFIGKKYKNNDGELVKFTQQDFDFLFPTKDGADRGAYDYHGVVEEMGFDGARILERADYKGRKVTSTVFNEGGLKVYDEEQLRKIREEANNSLQ